MQAAIFEAWDHPGRGAFHLGQSIAHTSTPDPFVGAIQVLAADPGIAAPETLDGF
jgi:hypothetical protein